MTTDTKNRLDMLGARALSEAELLSIAGQLSHDEARGALDVAGSLCGLSRLSHDALSNMDGIGTAKAMRICAALEIGRRCRLEDASVERVRGPKDIFQLMAPRIGHLDHEEFHAIYLSAQHRVKAVRLITRGILDASLIHPREVFRPAVEMSAAAVVLVHNHPSGERSMSYEDKQVTKVMQEAGKTMGIPVLDHVVIAGESYSAHSDN